MTTRPRGRPAHAWLEADAVATLPHGTAVSLELRGQNAARLLGRITDAFDACLDLHVPGRGEVSVALRDIRRGRIVTALFEPGDPVLLEGVPEGTWRGGVVRSSGTNVLVEILDGTWTWIPEVRLDPAGSRRPTLPALPRGPVPASR